MAFDRNRQLAVIASDLRRGADTAEKLNHPAHAKVTTAVELAREAAALLADVAGAAATAASPARREHL